MYFAQEFCRLWLSRTQASYLLLGTPTKQPFLQLSSQNSLVAFFCCCLNCPFAAHPCASWIGCEWGEAARTAHPNRVMDRDLDPNQDFIQRLGWGGGPEDSLPDRKATDQSSSSTITTITTTTTTTLLLLLLLFNSIYTKVFNLIPLYKIRTGKSFFITFSFETPFLLVSHFYLLFKILMICDGMKFWILLDYWLIECRPTLPTKLNSRLLLVLIQCAAAQQPQ